VGRWAATRRGSTGQFANSTWRHPMCSGTGIVRPSPASPKGSPGNLGRVEPPEPEVRDEQCAETDDREGARDDHVEDRHEADELQTDEQESEPGCRSDAWAKNICDQFDRDKVTLRVLNPVQAAEGNLVEVRFQTPPVGKSMIVVYLLPILALILGAVLGAAWNPLNNQDLSAVAGAVIVFICCLGLILGINRKNLGERGGNMPSITKILEDSQHQ